MEDNFDKIIMDMPEVDNVGSVLDSIPTVAPVNTKLKNDNAQKAWQESINNKENSSDYLSGRGVGVPGFGESKYDKDITSISQLQNLPKYRSESQPFSSALLNGVASRALAVIPKAGAALSYTTGAIGSLITGDINTMINSDFANSMEKADEVLREALPVYAGDKYNSDNIFDILSSQKFWFEDFTDGLAFMASAYIPAGAIGKLGKALELTGNAAKTFNAITPWAVTAYNTVSESAFESNDTYNTIKRNLEATDKYTPEEINDIASSGAANTFVSNSAILVLPDFIQSKFFLGGFNKNVSKMRKVMRDNVDDLSKVMTTKTGNTLKYAGLGVASEGLWEEGIQTAIQNYETRTASNTKKTFTDAITGYAKEWVNGFSTTEGQKSMILGALIGAPMGGVSGFQTAAEQNKQVTEFGESWKKNIASYLDTTDKNFKDRIGGITKNNGELDINKTVKSFYQTLGDRNVFNEATAATLNNDSFHNEFNNDMALSKYLYTFLSDDKHFESTDDALDYAISRIADMENVEGTDKEEFAKFKENASKVKDLYDQVQNKTTKFNNVAATTADIAINNIVNKALFYELNKRETLNKLKETIDESQKYAIDSLINDSQQKSDYLLSKEGRKNIAKEYKDISNINERRINNLKEIFNLNQKLNNDKTTSEEKTDAIKRIKELSYDNIEDSLIDGDGRISPLDIVREEIARERKNLGIRDGEYFVKGMQYKKKIARDETYSKYKKGETTSSDVFNSIINNVNENSPLNLQDKKILKDLFTDLRNKENDINRDSVEAYMNELQDAEGDESSLLEFNWTEDEISKSKKDFEILKEVNSVLPKIEGILSNSDFNLAGENRTKSEDDLKAIAANRFIDESVNHVINFFNSNKEGFDNVQSVDSALESLRLLETGLNHESRQVLLNSKKGQEIVSKVAKLRNMLNTILKVATNNQNNKTAADNNAKVNYGILRGQVVLNNSIFEILSKYMGGDLVNSIKNDFVEDNNNFIHIEKLVAKIKTADVDERKNLMSILTSTKDGLSDNLVEYIKQTLKENPTYTKEEIAAANPTVTKSRDRAEANLLKKLDEFLVAYKENPSSTFPTLLLEKFPNREEGDEHVRPIDVYYLNNNIAELHYALKHGNKSIGSGFPRIPYDSLISIVEQHMLIESIDSIEKSVNSNLDTLEYLNNEKKNALAEKTAELKLSPSRQQRIAIFELLRWFKSGNKGNGLGSFAYMKGLAGTGKTTVVSKLFAKFAGVDSKNIFAIGNNDSSTKTINDSLGTVSDKTISTIVKADIANNIELLFVDEIGAILQEEFDNLVSIVESINKDRAANRIKELKVVALGDPTQIVRKENFDNPIQSSRNTKLKDVTIITPLTIPFRSDINSVLEVQNVYHMNKNTVSGITVSASEDLGVKAKGVQAGFTKQALINQLNTHKDNGRTKVLVVGRDEDVDMYKSLLGDTIPGLEILTYQNVQGKTFENVFIDIDPSVNAISSLMSDSQKLTASTARNKIMYTATSRAKEYIFIFDHTGTFVNKKSDSIEESEKNNVKQKNEYQDQYLKDVAKDINIMKGFGIKVEKTKPSVKGQEEQKEDDVDNTISTSIEEEIIIEEDEPEIVDDSISEIGSESFDDFFEVNNLKDGDVIHNVKHTTNFGEKDGSNGVKTPYSKGDKVYYVKVERGKNKYVEMFTRNSSDISQESYFRVGVIDNEESLNLFGRTLDEVLNDDLITANAVGGNGQLHIKLSGNQSSIVGTGIIATTPRPITYVYKKDKDTSNNIVSNIMDIFERVFGTRGFTILSKELKIFKPNEVKKKKLGGVRAGVPYLIIDIQRDAKDGNGSIFQQYVKLSPRMVNKEKDASLLEPIFSFINSTEKIESIISDDNIKLGTKPFNDLIKKFKGNYKVSEDGSSIVEKTSNRVSLTEAKLIIPELTQEQFDNIVKIIEPLVKGFYGIGNVSVKMSEEEFKEQFIDNPEYQENTDYDGIYYVDSKERFFKYDTETGKVVARSLYTKGNGNKVLVDQKTDEKFPRKFLTKKDLVAGKGMSQISLNKLAKNNATPGDVNIRVRKTIKQKDSSNSYSFVTGKSLLSSGTSNMEYVSFLRRVLMENSIDIDYIDPKNEESIYVVEAAIIDNNIFTPEEMWKARTSIESEALSTGSLKQALGFEGDSIESSTLKYPIDLSEINDLGTDNLDEDAGNLVESRLDDIIPTTLNVKIDKPVAKKKDDTTTPPKDNTPSALSEAEQLLKDNEAFLKDNEDDILFSTIREFDSKEDEDKYLGAILSRESVVKLIKKRIPGIKEGQIQFVESIVKQVGDSSIEAWGSYVDGVISLVVDKNGGIRENIVKHEIFHKVYTERFSLEERRRIKSAFNKEFPKTLIMDRIELEEFMAEKYQLWKAGDYITDNNVIKKLFARLRDFFRFVSDNREYIESVFRDISNGLYKESGLNTIGGRTAAIKTIFDTAEDAKLAKKALVNTMSKLNNEGVDGYPISKNEIKEQVKYALKQRISENKTKFEAIINQLAKLEMLSNMPQDIYDKLDLQRQKFEKTIKLYSKTYKHFDTIFEFAYPTWDIKNFGSEDDLVNELFDEETSISIADDIIDWDTVNMEGKISAASKQFMSNIKWKQDNGTIGGYVNPRFAYIAALEIMNGVDESTGNIVDQINEKMKKNTNKMYRAVGNQLIDLYNNVSLGYVNENKVRRDAKFLTDGTFLYTKDPSAEHDILFAIGKNSLTTKGIQFSEVTRDNYRTKEFINKIIDETNDRFSKEDLFNLYSQYKNADLLKTVFSNFLSQRERDIKIIEITNNNGKKMMKFIGAKGRTHVSPIKDQIKNALTSLKNKETAIELLNYTKSIMRGVKTAEDKVEVINSFIKKLGLESLLTDNISTTSDLIDDVYNSIELLFVNSNALSEIYNDVNSELDKDEDAQKEEELIRNKLSSDVAKLTNSLLNNLAKLLGANSRVQRATSVTSASGKTKYNYVVGGQAQTILNNLKNRVKSPGFEGTSYHGLSALKLPPFITGSEYFSWNIFKKGINSIFQVEDFDGTTENVGYSRDSYTTEYKDEQYDNYMERAFSAQFIAALSASSSARKMYSQNLYTISNKPSNISVGVSPLNRLKAIEALNSMVTQIGKQKDFSKVKLGNKRRLVNFNVLGEAINNKMKGGATEIFSKGTFTHYELSDAAFAALSDQAFVKDISNDVYNLLIEKSKLVTQEFIDYGISIPVDNLNNDNITSIIDKVLFPTANFSNINYEKTFDWKTKKIITSKFLSPSIKFRETRDDILKRINKFYKTEFQNLDDAMAVYGELDPIFESQKLIEKEVIEPLVAAFVVNDYINSNQLTQLISGPFNFFKSANELTKRLSGASSPGIRGIVDSKVGMPERTNIAILDDEKFNVGTDIRALLKEGFGISEEDINSIISLFGDENSSFEYTDGQGFMLPERQEELIAGFGLNYGVGNVSKPAYYHIDENQIPRMLKYSSVVLTDELTSKYETLRVLRDKMRKGGKDGNIVYGEVVFASGNKVGTPTILTDVKELLNNKESFIQEDSGFEIYNKDYRLQLNPLHNPDSDVANPTQLGYFLNTMKNNVARAAKVYSALSKLINNGSDQIFSELSTKEGKTSKIKGVLRNGQTNKRTSEIFEHFTEKFSKIKTPWNYPAISSKLTTQLVSLISKSTVNVRFKGSKLVLQTAFGTDILKDNEELLRKEAKLNYKVKKFGNKENAGDILYAEVIVPRGMLPKELEQFIENSKEDTPEQFLYPDLLGFRLPSSELHSAIPLKIVGFYDAQGTNVIIAPKEIVALHGSDYDVDALYVIRREYDKDGNPIGYKKENEQYVFDDEFINSDKFNELSVDEQSKYLKNQILDTFLEAITIRENRMRMASPISMIEIKKAITKILKIKPKSKIRKNDSSFILDRQKTHASSFEALSGTGIFANGIKSLAYMQRTGKDGSDPKIISSEEINRAFVIDNQNFDTLQSDKKLWEDQDAFLNSAIDNVNEQDLPNVNMTKDNIKAFIALRGFGVDLDTSLQLFSQEFAEVLNKKGRRGQKYLKLSFLSVLGNGIIEKPSEGINSRDLTGEFGIRSELSLEDIFKKQKDEKELTEKELEYVYKQYEFFTLFNKALYIGDAISKISKVLSIIKQFPVTKFDIEKILNAKNNIFGKDSTFPIDVENFFKELPHVQAAYDALEKTNTKLEEMFYRYNPVIKTAVKEVYKNKDISYAEDPEEDDQKKTEEFMKFLLSSVKWDPAYKGFASEPERLTSKGNVLKGEYAFLDRMFESVSLLKNNPATKDNLFVSGISLGNGANAKKVINFAPASSMDYEDIIDYENAFDKLLYYEVVNGKIVKKDKLGNSKYTMELSKIQKDFMRYLILEQGLVHSKNNYAEVLPLRMMKIFHIQFEYLMDNVLANKTKLKELSNLFEVQVSVNNASSLPFIPSVDKVKIDEKNIYKMYIIDNESIFANFSSEPRRDAEGKIDVRKTNKDFPKFVRSGEKTSKTGNTYVDVYVQTHTDPETGMMYYQKVARQGIKNIYSVGKSGNEFSYKMNEAFRPDIRNITVGRPEEGNEALSNTNYDLRIGSTISLTAFADPARQDKYFYKVKGASNKTKDGKAYKKYSVELVSEPPTILGNIGEEEKYINFPNYKNFEDLSVREELTKVSNAHGRLAPIADLLLNRVSSLRNRINIDRDSPYQGVTLNENTVSKEGIIESNIRTIINDTIFNEFSKDEIIIHEEIHRYLNYMVNTSNEWAANGAILPLTKPEQTFVKEANELYNLYKNSSLYKSNPKFFKAKDIGEFLAYGLTNKDFIKQLVDIKVDNSTLLQKLINSIVKLFEGNVNIANLLNKSFSDLMVNQNLAADVYTLNIDAFENLVDRQLENGSTEITEEDLINALKQCGI